MLEQIEIDKIKVSRERFRDATGDIAALAASLASPKFGQLQPIILDDANELLDGFRRYTAAKSLGWTHIGFVRRDEIPELLAREIELETNIRREDMTWQERAKAVTEIDKIRRAQDPNWTQDSTAAVVESSRSRVTEAVQVTKMMEMFPEIGEAKSMKQALKMVQTKVKQVEQRQAVKNAAIDFSDIGSKIIHGDSTEVIKSIPSESFHAIITDPPFGINYEERTAGQTHSVTDSYEDSAETYRKLLGMAPELHRVLKKDGWLIWFLGISWYEEAKQTFRAAGFTVDEIPIMWDRSDGRTFTQRPDRYFGRGYDIALHCLKGNPLMSQRGKPNVLRIPPVDGAELLVERPVELYAELIRRLTIPKEIVADFFVGSGSCPAAAASLGRDFFGVEMNADRRAHAMVKIKSYIDTK